MTNEIPDIPLAMRKVYRRLKRWRGSHARRVPIPEPLWVATAELAREHGIFRTAKALHLEYSELKQRAEAVGAAKQRGVKTPSAAVPRAPSIAPPRFVELMAPRLAVPATCYFAGPNGVRPDSEMCRDF